MTRLLPFVVSVVLLLTSSNATAQDPLTQHRRNCLRGIGAIEVYVNHYRGEDEQARRLKIEVELRLRQAGIKVGPGAAILFLGRNQANIQEFGKFERRHGFSELPATTWESSLIWRNDDDRDWNEARKMTMAAVDELLNDYLAANETKAR